MTNYQASTRSSVASVPSQLVEDVLMEGLSDYFGRPLGITHLECRPLGEQSTHPISRLTVALDSGEHLPIIFKQLIPKPKDTQRHPEGTRQADPEGTPRVTQACGGVPGWDPKAHRLTELPKGNQREVLIYRQLLAKGRFGTPALYASLYDEQTGCYWLFLEDVGESIVCDGELEDWFSAVRWLAAMHGAYLGREDELRALGCLDEHGSQYYRTIAYVARWNLEQVAAGSTLARFDRVMEPFESVVACLVCQPRTLVHGDIFPHNLILQPRGRIRPIDWESAAIGLPVWDLVRLIDGWETDESSFLALYVRELSRQTGRSISRQAFDETVAKCRIVNLLWHLGWELETCRNAAFIDELLNALETSWSCLRHDSKLEAHRG